jgi:O-antigen/teichoic acid export membrane protein
VSQLSAGAPGGGRRVASNAIWNVLGLGSSALVALGVPPFIARLLPPSEFGAWALMMQLAGYVNLLGFGLQIVLARHVAVTHADGDAASRRTLVATAFWGLAALAASAVAAVALGAPWAGDVFPVLGASTHGGGGTALVGLTSAFAVLLPASALAAVFVGEQRSEVPALVTAATRASAAIAVVFATWLLRDLRAMAFAFLLACCGGAFTQWLVWRLRTAEPRLAISDASRGSLRRVWDECRGITEWNVCMLLVSGLNLVLVGHFDSAHLPYFAAAAVLSQFVTGLLSALASALVPEAARLSAGSRDRELGELIFGATRIINAGSVVVAATLIVAGPAILRLWVGPEYAEHGALLLALLATGAGLRLLMLPYATASVGLGLQRRLTAMAWLEGVVTLASSLLLGPRLGALGVAISGVIGATIGNYGLLRVHALGSVVAIDRRRYALHCLVPPLACLGVAAAAWLLPGEWRTSLWAVPATALAAAMAAAAVVLSAADRSRLSGLAKSVLGRP